MLFNGQSAFPGAGSFNAGALYIDGMNIYAFAFANPVNWTDPMGLWGDDGEPRNFQDMIDEAIGDYAADVMSVGQRFKDGVVGMAKVAGKIAFSGLVMYASATIPGVGIALSAIGVYNSAQNFASGNWDYSDVLMLAASAGGAIGPVTRLLGKLGSKIGAARASYGAGSVALNARQLKNFKRFTKKLPKGAKQPEVHDLPSGGRVFRSEVPGKVPGSKAIYEKRVDAAGNTVSYTKTTIDPDGNVVHVKQKYP